MVEGGDRTDRSSACGGSGDYGRQPDGPEEFDWNSVPKAPTEVGAGTGTRSRLHGRAALDEVRQSQGIGTQCETTGGPLCSVSPSWRFLRTREEVGVHLEAQVLGQTQMVAHGGFQDSEHCAYLALP